MATLFISDLHLSPEARHITQTFLTFLQKQARQCDALYILGDLFEAWLGDDTITPYNTKIINALRELQQFQVPLYFLPGNRDFLIGQQFAEQAACTILPDPCTIQLYGETILLTHGDHLCTRDKYHQYYRRLVRNAIVPKLFLKLPLRLRHWVANRLRQKSKQRAQNLSVELMDVTPELVPKLFEQFPCQLAIHGHTHRPSIHWLCMNNMYRQRIVLSDWGKLGNALVCSPDGRKRLVYFDTQGPSSSAPSLVILREGGGSSATTPGFPPTRE